LRNSTPGNIARHTGEGLYKGQLKGLSNRGFIIWQSPFACHSERVIRSGLMVKKKIFTHMQIETQATGESLAPSRYRLSDLTWKGRKDRPCLWKRNILTGFWIKSGMLVRIFRNKIAQIRVLTNKDIFDLTG
jgi:hypothetical protein